MCDIVRRQSVLIRNAPWSACRDPPIVFAFGITHDSNAILPLLATTLVSHGFATVVMKRSIMTEKVARRGFHMYREYGVHPRRPSAVSLAS
jgi:H+/Cl- antiporter ClcA